MAVIHQTAYDEFIKLITSSPSLEDIADFRLSDETEARIDYLLEANEHGTITPEEEAELDDYLRLEHIMRLAKIRAVEQLEQR